MSGAGAIDRYLRRLADAPAGEERRVEDAVAPLTDLLPGARAVALESLDGRFTAVALAAADRRPVAAPPLGPLIRRVIAAGEAVHVRRGTGALYRDAALAAHLGEGELLVAAVAVRRDVVAALSLHADEITPGERETLAHAAAAIGLWLTLSGPAPAPAVPPAAHLRDARALAAEGRAGAALTAAGRALGLRADLAPAGERVAVMRTCSCPHHREIAVAGAGEALGRVLVHGWAPIADDAAEELAAVARTALLAERLARRDELPLADRLDDLGGASDPPWRAVGRVTPADLAAPLTVLLAAGPRASATCSAPSAPRSAPARHERRSAPGRASCSPSFPATTRRPPAGWRSGSSPRAAAAGSSSPAP
jgi:hypothetical protein